MDISGDKFHLIAEHELRAETRRFGPFVFRLGFDPDSLAWPYQRVLECRP